MFEKKTTISKFPDKALEQQKKTQKLPPKKKIYIYIYKCQKKYSKNHQSSTSHLSPPTARFQGTVSSRLLEKVAARPPAAYMAYWHRTRNGKPAQTFMIVYVYKQV